MLHFPHRSHTGHGAEIKDEIITGLTYSGCVIHLPLSQCVGISFDFQAANLRDTVDGQIMIVSKSNHAWGDFWPWFILLTLHILLGYVIWYFIGPLSSISLLSIFITLTVRSGTVSKLFIASCFLAFLWLTYDVYVYVFALVLAIALASARASGYTSTKLHFVVPKRAQMAYVFEFNQDELAELLKIRRIIVENIQHRHLVCESWVSNRYAEYIMSLLLPDFIYNHAKVRRLFQLVSDFFIPIFAILQGLSILFPWLSGNLILFWQLVQEDIGTRFLREFFFPIVKFCLGYLSSSRLLQFFIEFFIQLRSSFASFFTIFNFCRDYILRLHYFVVYITSQLPVGALMDFFSNTFLKLASNIAVLFRFGRRTPEHIVVLTKRISETSKIVWDKCRQKSSRPATPLPSLQIMPVAMAMAKIPFLSLSEETICSAK
jgi:hypothetical protein